MLFCGDFIFQNGLDVLRMLELQMERLNVHCGKGPMLQWNMRTHAAVNLLNRLDMLFCRLILISKT